LNSLLQSLYFTNAFRKAVYAIPTEEVVEGATTGTPVAKGRLVAYALQRLFYEMQTSKDAVSTRDLTKSFGWNTIDAFYQHDVQELNRVLQDMLEETMKGTAVEGVIEKLFTGKMKSFIRCKNVDFTSERSEVYYDVGVSVKGFHTLEDSFKEYVSTETMDGENQYFAEGYGLQDAIKGFD
jgi:ubiquitin carboxyl-terminal hydrolase 7